MCQGVAGWPLYGRNTAVPIRLICTRRDRDRVFMNVKSGFTVLIKYAPALSEVVYRPLEVAVGALKKVHIHALCTYY